MTGLTSELAERSAALSFDQLPDDVVAMTRLCVLDWFGVTVVGGYETACRVAAVVGPMSYLRGFHHTGTIG